MLFHRAKDRNFYGVALAFILVGAGVLAVSAAEAVGAWLWSWQVGWPAAKFLAGLVIVGLGYIILELELIRHKP